MPQGEKSMAERVQFDFMLQNVNLLYLGLKVLILLDQTYVSRFWTQFEAWLSMQKPSASGLTPAQDEDGVPRRFHIVPIHSANDKLAESLEDTWAVRTPEQATKVLENKDVTVTNKSDKDKQLPKLLEMHKEVQEAFKTAPPSGAQGSVVYDATSSLD